MRGAAHGQWAAERAPCIAWGIDEMGVADSAALVLPTEVDAVVNFKFTSWWSVAPVFCRRSLSALSHQVGRRDRGMGTRCGVIVTEPVSMTSGLPIRSDKAEAGRPGIGLSLNGPQAGSAGGHAVRTSEIQAIHLRASRVSGRHDGSSQTLLAVVHT